MKYLKYFESNSILDKVASEIESISYILEDEGYYIKITKEQSPVFLRPGLCSLVIFISFGGEESGKGPHLPGHWTFSEEVSWNNNLSKKEFFKEFIDRCEEICQSNGLSLEKEDQVFLVYKIMFKTSPILRIVDEKVNESNSIIRTIHAAKLEIENLFYILEDVNIIPLILEEAFSKIIIYFRWAIGCGVCLIHDRKLPEYVDCFQEFFDRCEEICKNNGLVLKQINYYNWSPVIYEITVDKDKKVNESKDPKSPKNFFYADIKEFSQNIVDELNLYFLIDHRPGYSVCDREWIGNYSNNYSKYIYRSQQSLYKSIIEENTYNGILQQKRTLSSTGFCEQYINVDILIKRDYFNKNRRYVLEVIQEFEDRLNGIIDEKSSATVDFNNEDDDSLLQSFSYKINNYALPSIKHEDEFIDHNGKIQKHLSKIKQKWNRGSNAPCTDLINYPGAAFSNNIED